MTNQCYICETSYSYEDDYMHPCSICDNKSCCEDSMKFCDHCGEFSKAERIEKLCFSIHPTLVGYLL